MAMDTVAAFVEAVRQHRLLEPEQLDELSRGLQPRFAEPRALARHLIQKGWLTPYQLNQIFQGQASALVLGQYRLLERIGEGGMGQVFKARHHAMGRIVALKVIRKERLANAEAVKRFQREIQAASQLSHPNVVMAYDANAVGATHYLAMEFVEGIDLAELCRQRGPLPVAEACDAIRQAALGLQYAHDQGMVHRDIKPSNLLKSAETAPGNSGPKSGSAPRARPPALVKILDMGLARLQPHEQQDMGNSLSQDGSVMGTPDFMAPEQAKNSHRVDHRADIYSLGCTFYFLLTGRPPFSGATHLEKLLKHQMDAPPPIDAQRPDVPIEVLRLLGRMLAKRPEDRPARADEVAAGLAPFSRASATTPVRHSLPGSVPTAQPIGRFGSATAVLSQAMRTTDLGVVSTPEVRAPQPMPPANRRPRKRPLALIAAAVVLLGGVFALAWAMSGTSKPSSPLVVATATGKTLPAPPTTATATERVKPPVEAPLHRYLPDDSQLVVVLRVPEIVRSNIYKRTSERLEPINRKIAEGLKGIGIDWDRDVQRMIIAAPSGSKTNDDYVLLQGTFSADKTRQALKRLSPRSHKVGTETYYEFADTPKGEARFAALIAPGMLALATTEPPLINVLERLASPQRGEFKDAELRRLLEQSENRYALRVLAGAGFVFDDKGTRLQNAIPGFKNASASFSPAGDGIDARVLIHFKGTEDASDLEAAIKGFLGEMAKIKQTAGLAENLLKAEFRVVGDKHILAIHHRLGPKVIDFLLLPR